LAITLIKLENNADEMTHIESTDFLVQQNIQIEKTLEPGNYLVIPKTTGCLCFGRNPLNINTNKENKTEIYDKKKKCLTPIFKNMVLDVFKKFDLARIKLLKYEDFKEFWLTILDDEISEENFRVNIINKYAKGKEGINEAEFLNFFKEIYLKQGEVNILYYT
jgi:hypothetical protein